MGSLLEDPSFNLPQQHAMVPVPRTEFRVIVDNKRNGETSIRDELTVCHWEEAYINGNKNVIIILHSAGFQVGGLSDSDS